jgi:hypothetical protein
MAMMRAIAAWFTARHLVVTAFLLGWVLLIVVGAGRTSDADQLVVLPDLGDVFLTALGVYAVLAFVLLLFLRPTPTPARSRATRGIRTLLLVTIFLVALAIVFPPTELSEEESPPQAEGAVTQPAAVAADVDDEQSGATSTDVAALALILLIVVAVLVRSRRRTGLSGTNVEDVPDEAAEADISLALKQATDHLQFESDPRKAVMVAYASLEQALVERGYLCDPAQTPTEYLGSVLAAMPALADPAIRLGHLYELARFSDKPITNDDRDRAVDALARVRHDLTKSIGVT